MKVLRIVLVVLMLATAATLAFSASEQEEAVEDTECQADLTKSLSVDTSGIKTTDNQPLVEYEKTRNVPTKPADPSALPEMDALHWYEIEYAGYNTVKMDMPERPACGAYGKYVVLLQPGQHPYWTSWLNGFNKIAEAYNLKTKIYNANWALDLQAQQVEQAINDKPDMIVMGPTDQAGSVPMLRKLWQAGIPVVTSNVAPSEEGMKYCLAHVGPEDWEYYRKSARYMADKLGKKGGYVVVQSIPGISCFNSRYWSVVTELVTYAPNMKLLDADTSMCQTEPTFALVSTWLAKYGDELQGIILPDAGPTVSGTMEAARKAGRYDLVIMTGGHCKLAQDAVKTGEFPGITLTYQSGESDGACALQVAVDWMNGKDLKNVYAIKQGFITSKEVDNYYPAQH